MPDSVEANVSSISKDFATASRECLAPDDATQSNPRWAITSSIFFATSSLITRPKPGSHSSSFNPVSAAKTLFEKIAAREIPAKIHYEDDLVLAFSDIQPQAPIHVLIVPKKPIARIGEASADDQNTLGHLLLKAADVARSLGIESTGYRLVINNGRDGGESVPHLHVHILGGRPLHWPPG